MMLQDTHLHPVLLAPARHVSGLQCPVLVRVDHSWKLLPLNRLKSHYQSLSIRGLRQQRRRKIHAVVTPAATVVKWNLFPLVDLAEFTSPIAPSPSTPLPPPPLASELREIYQWCNLAVYASSKQNHAHLAHVPEGVCVGRYGYENRTCFLFLYGTQEVRIKEILLVVMFAHWSISVVATDNLLVKCLTPFSLKTCTSIFSFFSTFLLW